MRMTIAFALGLLTGAAACVGICLRQAKREGRL